MTTTACRWWWVDVDGTWTDLGRRDDGVNGYRSRVVLGSQLEVFDMVLDSIPHDDAELHVAAFAALRDHVVFLPMVVKAPASWTTPDKVGSVLQVDPTGGDAGSAAAGWDGPAFKVDEDEAVVEGHSVVDDVDASEGDMFSEDPDPDGDPDGDTVGMATADDDLTEFDLP